MAIIEIRFVKTVVIDSETNQILSVVETVENKEGVAAPTNTTKAKKTTKKAEVVDSNPNPIVKLEDGKLVFTQSAADLIGVKPGDKVCISFIQNEDNTFSPVIGNSENMGDCVGGNKMTKSLTVSYKGKQATTLSQYGKEFTLSLDDDVIARMEDKNHVGLVNIPEDDLAPMPKASTFNDDLDFFTKSEEKKEEHLQESKENVTFDFDFNF